MEKVRNLLRAVKAVTVVIMLSKALGFARDMITAYYYGTGMESDAYASAYGLFYIPILLLNSCITSTVVPQCVKRRAEYGRDGADRLGSVALNVFCGIAIALTVLLYVFAPQLVSVIYASFTPDKAALTADLVRIMLITMVFHIAAIVMSSLLNAQEKYVPAQLMGFPLSVCVILSTVLFSRGFGVRATAWGVCGSSVAEALILLPFLKGGFRYRAVSPVRNADAAGMLKAGAPALLSMAVSELNHMIDRFLASGLGTGAIAGMNYAFKLITFLLGVLMVPLTTVAFSRLSRLVAEKDRDGMGETVRNCLRLILLVSVPIALIGGIMARDVVIVAYRRGNFNADSVRLTQGALLYYIIGLPAFGMRDMMNRVFHSEGDTRTPFRAAVLTVCVNVGLNLILMRTMGVNGLALATSIAGYVGLVMLLAVHRKRYGRLTDKTSLYRLFPILPGAALAYLTAGHVSRALEAAESFGQALGRFAVATAAGLAAYAVITGGMLILGARRAPKRRRKNEE